MERKEYRRLIDIFPDYAMSGIFQYIGENYNIPWASKQVDILYMAHSGNKIASPLLMNNQTVAEIASLIMIYTEKNWNTLSKLFNIDYDPLNNYDMIEVETPRTTRKIDRNGTANSNGSLNVNDSESIYGFNSTSSSPANEGTRGSNSTQDTSTEDHTTESTGGDRTLTRSGNIGVTTSQQMFKQEIELRKTHFLDIIFDDVDKLITLPIY